MQAPSASSRELPPPPAAADLPAPVRAATAVLSAPGGAAVYVLGVSHVSAVACEQVRQLVGAVKPEVVVVELCKDRTGLLVDPDTTAKAPDTWICTRTEIEGLPGSDKDKEEDKDDEKEAEGATAEEKAASKARRAADRAAAAAAWPRAAELAPLLRTRIGRAVTTAEVEGDAATLEATGLFKRVRPLCEGARRGDAPLFSAVKAEDSASMELEFVSPLGCTRFLIEPRTLPPILSMAVRLDSSLKGVAGLEQSVLDAVGAEAAADCAAEPPRAALLAYLVVRRKLIDMVEAAQRGAESSSSGASTSGGSGSSGAEASSSSGSGSSGVVVEFSGIETGKVEAVVRARRPGGADAPFVSGLESSAEGGEGVGIERFRPVKRGVQLSPRMSLPAEAAARMNALKAAKRAEAARTARGGSAPAAGSRFPFRFWRPEEVPPADLSRPPSSPPHDALAALLTGAFSSLQTKAGRAAGVAPGAAWRAAMEAATEAGALQVVLGDRPAMVSQRRLADGMFVSTAARLAAAVGLLAAAAAAPRVAGVADALGGAGLPGGDAGVQAAAAAAGLVAAAGVMWPVLGPLVEVWRFSRLDGPQVEEVVVVKEPIQVGALMT
jgi:hypothetical protein